MRTGDSHGKTIITDLRTRKIVVVPSLYIDNAILVGGNITVLEMLKGGLMARFNMTNTEMCHLYSE